MPQRITMVFQMTTEPTDRSVSDPHTAGWTESLWSNATVPLDGPSVRDLCKKRANLLPQQASIIGVRSGLYTFSGPKIMPNGSSTAKLKFPGNSGLTCDMPQNSLEIGWTSAASANASRQSLRGCPDNIIKGGEYAPTSAFKRDLNKYIAEITGYGWYFVGRNLTALGGAVVSITGALVVTTPLFGVATMITRLRFINTKDDNGDPVTGSYLVTSGAGGGYTLQGFGPRTLTRPNGYLRHDQIQLCLITGGSPSRTVVRKVGRPFASYRGRQSKGR